MEDSGYKTPNPMASEREGRNTQLWEEQSMQQTSTTPYRLFNREKSIHQVLGGGKAADVILWRKRSICIGILVASSATWLMFEQSGYTFVSIFATMLLILHSIVFVSTNVASYLQRPPPFELNLVLSEETVIGIAFSVCKKLNSILGVVRAIVLNKDVKLFLKVALALCTMAFLGRYCNFLTLAYICLILCLSVPALYNKYEDKVDKSAEKAHHQILEHYKSFDEKVLRKIPRSVDRNILGKIPKQLSAVKDKSN